MIVLDKLFSEGLADVDSIVSVVGLDGDTQVTKFLFKIVLGSDGVSCIQRHLQLRVDVGGVGIDKYGGSTVPVLLRLLASSVEEPTTDGRFQLITKHTRTGSKASLD